MKKKNKKTSSKRRSQKRKTTPPQSAPNPSAIAELGEMGIFSRSYPSAKTRAKKIKILEKLAPTDRSSDDWWLLGEYKIFDGLLDENEQKINEGIQALSEGANHVSPSPACFLDLAWIQMHKGLHALALPALIRSTELAPRARDPWSLRGLCHAKLGDRTEAINAYKTAVNLSNYSDADNDILKQLEKGGDLQKVTKDLLFLKISPEEIWGKDFSAKETQKAIRFFLKRSIEADPDNHIAYKSLGAVHYALEEFDAAENNFLAFLNIEKEDAEVYTALALIAKKRDKAKDTEADFYRKALAVRPDHLLALVNLSSLLQDDGKFYEARPLLDLALQGDQRDPDYALALDLYGNNLGSIEEDFSQEAEYHFRARQLAPKNPLFLANHILALLFSGNVKEAKSLFERNVSLIARVPNRGLLGTLCKVYNSRERDPFFYLNVIEEIRPLIGLPATKPLLSKAWSLRGSLESFFSSHAARELSVEDLEYFYYDNLGVLAGQAGDHELAIEIWDEAFHQLKSEKFLLNKAVELSRIRKNGEALHIINSIELQDNNRSYTIQGNIRMNSGLHLAAIESYEIALKRDERFLLPILNGIDCCQILQRPDLLLPFQIALQEAWVDSREARLLLGNCYLLQGRPTMAAEIFCGLFVDKGDFRDPDELCDFVKGDSQDLSIFGSTSIENHKNYALSLLLSAQFDSLREFVIAVMSWPKWHNGDWMILEAEVERRQGNLEKAEEIISEMSLQPSPLLTKALCVLERMDFELAGKLAEEVLKHPDNAKNFNHPEGRPDAVAKSIVALSYLHKGEILESLKLASQAISNDVGCSIARTTYASASNQLGTSDDAIRSLLEGLSHTPGSPALLRMAIELMVEENKIEEASETLKENRQQVIEYGMTGLPERLGELIALAKLKQYDNNINLEDGDMGWAVSLSEVSQSWLKAGLGIYLKNLDLPEAYLFYLAKVVEKEYGDRIFYPFRDSLEDPSILSSDEFSDFSRFLSGNYAPSIGAMQRVLKAAAKDSSPADSELIVDLRKFLSSQISFDPESILNKKLLGHLNSLAHVRNSLAHIGEPDSERLNRISNLILDDKKPGVLLVALGFKVDE